MSAKRKPEPRRVRLTVPAADTSVTEWLDLQDDASVSMRYLVRESIEKDGYTDVVNRPVEKQPRRGRPPKTEYDGFDDSEQPEVDPVSDEAQAPAPVEAVVEETPAPDEQAAEPEAQKAPEPAKPAEKKEPASAMDAFLTS